jgi:cytochrome c oxidase subunit 3
VSAAVPAPHTHRDPEVSRVGMWLFLLTEMLLFAGCFLAYAVFRVRYSGDFHFAAQELNLSLGLVNTLVLLTSSLTMVLAIAAMEQGRAGRAAAWTGATIALGAVFLVVKGFEWAAKFRHGIYPNSPALAAAHTPGEQVFYGLYYTLTGLHALHVVIGMVVLAVMLVFVLRAARSAEGEGPGALADRLENAGLYWHLVDVIWIFLFPLFYLIS